MTPKARFLASQKARMLRTDRIEIEEEIIPTESAESDPDCGAEVLDFDEVKAELGVKSGRA